MIPTKLFDESATLPSRKFPLDAGLDLYATEDAVIPGVMQLLGNALANIHDWIYTLTNYVVGLSESSSPAFRNIRNTILNNDPAVDKMLEQCSYKFDIKVGVAIPPEYVGIVADKSGRGSKLIKVFGGIIDCGYVDSIKVVVCNFGFETWQVKKGSAIAQLLIVPCNIADCVVVDTLPNYSERKEQGFGSTDLTQ